jgi:hypothetical protein
MTNMTLDRISMGNPIIPENGLFLENKGKVTFKLHVNRNTGPYWPDDRYVDQYAIRGKDSSGKQIWGQGTGETELVDKQTFLKQVNEDLSEMNGYLAEAKYGRRFPAFWMHKVEGVLYKETEKKIFGNFQGDIE